MLPYNRNLKERARRLRKELTEAEKKLWSSLRNQQINNLQFYRQKPIGYYIADFYAPKANLIIEVDGSQHLSDENQKGIDLERTQFFKSLGLKVIRFTNTEVLKNLEGG
ncbi:MAG: DUF559 domain-containing protein [bacterium]|nr:DUF559 domain-containing protein [bacterium]